jgi:hypothetical protein
MPCTSVRAARAFAVAFLLALSVPAFAQVETPAPAPAPPPDLPAPLPSPTPPPPEPAVTLPPPAVAPPVDGPMPSPFAGAPWASPTVGHVPWSIAYRVTWLPDEAVRGQDTHLGFVQNDAALRFPIWQTESDELSGNMHVRALAIQTGAILPDTGQAFPSELWSIHAGATYRHLFENGWIAGGSLSVGSSSDKPFHSIDEMNVGVNGFLRIPSGEHNAWLLSLSYSPMAELNFPMPGVAYVWVPSDQLRMNIGLPFQVTYRPIDDLTLDFSYMLLTTIHARASYRVCAPLRVYAGFDWSNESWYRVGRPDVHDRLFYYEKRLSVGAQTHLGRMFLLDVSTGYAFDRYFFEGRHSSDSSFNRIDIADAPLLSLQAQLRW